MSSAKTLTASVMFALIMPAWAHAQVSIDVSKLTCRDFLSHTVTSPDKIAYWLSGYYNAKHGNNMLDLNGLRNYIDQVESYCQANQSAMFMPAAEKLLDGGK